jgi:T5SS/PEP-CTERM-associated repeat protein/autotransporter-associated beta strand protein
VNSNEVTFRDNSSPFVTSPNLTVANPDVSIVIGEGAGEVAVLTTSLRSVSGAKASIGRNPGSTGTLNVIAGAFSMSGLLEVGRLGTGTLTVSAGGSVSSTVSVLGRADLVGDNIVSGNGTVNVVGAGSQLTNSGDLFLGAGFGATGALTIEQGGSVTSTSAYIGSLAGIFGWLGSGTGTVTVTGADSTLAISDELVISDDGSTLSIQNGGNVTSAHSGISEDGMVTVSGIGSTWISGSLGVAMGTLRIEASGSVSSNGASIAGFFPNETGTATVTGAGSTWTINGNLNYNLIVGSGGTGVLSLQDGGSASVGGAGRVLLGNASDSHGTLRIGDGGAAGTLQATEVTSGLGTALVIFNHADIAHSFAPRLTGSVSVRHEGTGTTELMADTTYTGSTLVTAGKLKVQQGLSGGGDVTVAGGHLDVMGGLAANGGTVRLESGILSADSISLAGGGAFDMLGGTLHVDTFTGNLTNQAGSLAPGRSAGNTTIIGNYTQHAGAKLEIEIGGTSAGGSYDLVGVTGNAVLGGALQLSLINGFVPAPNQTFTLLNTANPSGLLGVFSNVTTGQRLATVDGLGSFLVHYGAGSAFNQNQIILTAFALAGDYNNNGSVDAADYVVWRKNVGAPAGTLPNDIDGGLIGPAQYATWRTHFGEPTSGSAVAASYSAVPEPATMPMLIVAAATVSTRRRWPK